MDSQLPIKQSFTKESLKKKFRLSEFLAEKIISSIAFLSIAIIFLIFIFVFKESLPLFSLGNDDKAKTEIHASTANKPESYGSSSEELKPESYGAETAEDLKPESYGTETTEDLKPESYGDTPKEDLTVAPVNEMMNAESQNQEGSDRTWSTFFSTEWVPVSDNPRFGLIGLLIGTLKVTIIAISWSIGGIGGFVYFLFCFQKSQRNHKTHYRNASCFSIGGYRFFCIDGIG
jgi:phosphate transport system permease protein